MAASRLELGPRSLPFPIGLHVLHYVVFINTLFVSSILYILNTKDDRWEAGSWETQICLHSAMTG